MPPCTIKTHPKSCFYYIIYRSKKEIVYPNYRGENDVVNLISNLIFIYNNNRVTLFASSSSFVSSSLKTLKHKYLSSRETSSSFLKKTFPAAFILILSISATSFRSVL